MYSHSCIFLTFSLVAYDAESGYGFLHRLDSTLLVDLTLCSSGSPPLIHKPMIMLIGDLERYTVSRVILALTKAYIADINCTRHLRQESLPIAMAMEQLAPSESLSDLVLRAALLRSCDGLDFQSWDQAARTESATRWSEAMR